MGQGDHLTQVLYLIPVGVALWSYPAVHSGCPGSLYAQALWSQDPPPSADATPVVLPPAKQDVLTAKLIGCLCQDRHCCKHFA
jgi:hypothetical protein